MTTTHGGCLKTAVVTTFHRPPAGGHGTVVTTAKTTVPCPPAPLSLPDDGMLFLSLKTF